MSKLVAVVAFATVIASPAFAQSFDPSVGSGNIVPQIVEDGALGAYARRAPQQYKDTSGRTVLPYTLQEHRALDRARGIFGNQSREATASNRPSSLTPRLAPEFSSRP
jgi:hypothetical protein